MSRKRGKSGQDKSESKHAAPFIDKLLTIISDPETDRLISWNEDGETFIVHQSQEMAKHILPKYFKHSNYTSFVRQLNMYGFHKVVRTTHNSLKTSEGGQDQNWEFVHPSFKRDQPSLLVHVKRKDKEVAKKTKPVRADMDDLLLELAHLREQNTFVQTRFSNIQQENQALWTNLEQLRTQHQQQQFKISRIMEFLKRLFNPNTDDTDDISLPRKRQRLALAQGNPAVNAAVSRQTELMGSMSDPAFALNTDAMPDMADVQSHVDEIEKRLHSTQTRMANSGVVDPCLVNGLYAHHLPSTSQPLALRAPLPPVSISPSPLAAATVPAIVPSEDDILYSPLDHFLSASELPFQQRLDPPERGKSAAKLAAHAAAQALAMDDLDDLGDIGDIDEAVAAAAAAKVAAAQL